MQSFLINIFNIHLKINFTMALSKTLELSQQDILQNFKAKVEDALSLLPFIQESFRPEIWTYWQVVSLAVKTATGGRGSAVKRQRRHLLSKSHLKVTSVQQRQQNDSISNQYYMDQVEDVDARSAEADNNEEQEDVKTGLPAKGGLTEPEPAGDPEIDSLLVDQQTLVSPLVTDESPAKVECHALDSEGHTGVEVDSACTHQEFVVTVSRGLSSSGSLDDSPRVDIVPVSLAHKSNSSLPGSVLSKSATESDAVQQHAENSSLQSVLCLMSDSVPTETDSSCITPTSMNNGDCDPTPSVIPANNISISNTGEPVAPVKRKRGRPPKNSSSSLSPQLLTSTVHQSSGDLDTIISELEKEVQQNKTMQSIQQMKKKGSPIPANPSSSHFPGKAFTKDLNAIIRALEDELATVTTSTTTFTENTASISTISIHGPATEAKFQSSASVRRSERRIAPNRDKLFCYFDVTHQREGIDITLETCDKSSINQESHKLIADASEEVRRNRMKTKEDKLKERTCFFCNTVLGSSSSMAAHLRTHTGDRPFVCHVCNKQFTTKANCERHEATHVGLKAFMCPECNKSFTEKKSLKIHMRCHTGERPYECKVCLMRFYQTGTLKTHMDRHTGHKGHLCDLCGRAFRQRCQLRVHMRRHTKNRAFSCQHCIKAFYTKSDMERHLLKHTGQRPFSCTFCSKTFTRLQYLREHENMHTGQRPYGCSECDMTFHDVASCHRHVQKHRQQLLGQSQVVSEEDQNGVIQLVPEVQVILDEQNLGTDIHTLIVTASNPSDPQHYHHHLTSSASTEVGSTTTITGHNMPVSHTIFNGMGLNSEEATDIYHITLLETPAGLQVEGGVNGAETVTGVDFSAMNLLANATSQMTLPG